MRHRIGAFLCLFAGLLSLSGACSIDNPGVTPPDRELNFPIALVVDPGSGHLFVANSNFDLRYNAGSLQSYRLSGIEDQVAACDDPPCVIQGDETPFIDEVLVGSHVSGMALSPAGDRLYLSVRSDSNLTYVDVDPDGGLDCGQRGGSARCADSHRRGDEAVASARAVSLPSDPVGVVAGDASMLGGGASGDFALMAHRSGRVSLFLEEVEGSGGAPTLVHVMAGLPEGLVNISLSPGGIAWVSSSQEAVVGRVGVAVDAETSDLLDSFLFDFGDLTLVGLDTAGRGDTRDVAFDPRPDVDRAYVLSRRPEAVLVADRDTAAPGDLNIAQVIPVGYGPSRLDVEQIDVSGDGSDVRTLLFASCFDSRDVWVIDPDLGTAVTVIRGMSGPFELAVDPTSNLLYVADFRASVVRVADLAPLVTCLRDASPTDAAGLMGLPSCEPETVVTLGDPRPVRDLL